MNLVLSGPIDPTLLNLCVARTHPREVIKLHEHARRLVGAEDSPTARTDIANLCEQARVDHAFVEEGLRFSDFKLLAMDMDSTLITIECIDEIADYAGKKAEVAAITEATMRGEITDFAESLRRRVSILSGLSADALDFVYCNRLTMTPGALELMRAAFANGIYTLLLSGGFTYFSTKLKESLGIDEAYANHIAIEQGVFTGQVKDPIFDSFAKAGKVVTTLQSRKIAPDEALAIGDGANDILMLKAVTHSIAFHAKTIVRENSKYVLDFGPLSVILDYFA